ncbi:MAG: putative polymerase subfamily sigma factor [Ilumatobacteraceae bacterium]|nr:putative polymerase subfamily sigma factor [Ilumatobacteraceae bacterium]
MSEIDNPAPVTPETLWRMYAAELLRFATMLVGPADAGDIVSEAMLRSERFVVAGTVDQPRAYLFRAVANQASDLRRTRTRRWARDLAAIGPTHADAPDTFIDVRRAVARLSVVQRAVVYLAYWGDMTEREIADLLDVAPGTVHRHLEAARHHLRRVL